MADLAALRSAVATAKSNVADAQVLQTRLAGQAADARAAGHNADADAYQAQLASSQAETAKTQALIAQGDARIAQESAPPPSPLSVDGAASAGSGTDGSAAGSATTPQTSAGTTAGAGSSFSASESLTLPPPASAPASSPSVPAAPVRPVGNAGSTSVDSPSNAPPDTGAGGSLAGGSLAGGSPIGARGPDGLTTQDRASILQQHAADNKAFGQRLATGGVADGEVTIRTTSSNVSGWTDVTISAGLDRAPATFELGMTYPPGFSGNAQDAKLKGQLDAARAQVAQQKAAQAKYEGQIADARASGEDLDAADALQAKVDRNKAETAKLQATIAQGDAALAIAAAPIAKGDPCTILIGGDVVITGYVNRVISKAGPDGHTIRVSGRSRVQDLVDCSALPDTMSIVNVTISNLARKLIGPFAGPIGLKLPDGDGLGRPYQFSVSLGQTPWELIGQVAAYEGLLVYDDSVGDVVISKVGTQRMASGFEQSANVEEFELQDCDDQLFSIYVPVLQAQDSLANIGHGGNDGGAPVRDPGVKRYRPMVVISDQMVGDQKLAQLRATWEATRRRGRSRVAQVVCDSWRDAAGALWTHNKLAPVDLPSVGLVGALWIIADWTFRRDAKGTRAEITLMAPEAFSVEPSALNGVNYLIAEAAQAAALGNAYVVGQAPVTAPNAGNATDARSRERQGYGL